MARSLDPRDLNDTDDLNDAALSPVEEEPELDERRRAASARFDVTAEVGSDVILREAMDPANQSLRDALRLSYRVLQLVILVLLVLFVFSGFQTVETHRTGVRLQFGGIAGEPGREALEPGAHFSIFPYPIGEFLIFEDRNRPIALEYAFWPRMRPNQSFEQAVEAALTSTLLQPGPFRGDTRGDGYVITGDGDIAHLQLRGQYEVDDPIGFIRTVENRASRAGSLDGDRLVEIALMRAVTLHAARTPLARFTEMGDQERVDLRAAAQAFIDRTGAGLRVAEISFPPTSPTPVFAIRKADLEVQSARSEAGRLIEDAQRQAQSRLIELAGTEADRLLDAIDLYQIAVDSAESDTADAALARINAMLEAPDMQGEVAERISQAFAYRSLVEGTLGNEARRFSALLPTWRESASLVRAELWSDTIGYIRSRPDAETLAVPDGLGLMRLIINGSGEVAKVRRQQRLDRSERAAAVAGLDLLNPRFERAQDMRSGAGRQLDRQAGSMRRD